MHASEFEHVFNTQVKRSEDILVIKAREYATEDRLHNFKKTSALTGETPAQVLAGFMAKHTVSLYDMIGNGKEYTDAQWDEKITDHINYLILLKAVLVEQAKDEHPTLDLNHT